LKQERKQLDINADAASRVVEDRKNNNLHVSKDMYNENIKAIQKQRQNELEQ